jgi:uncharacterized OB-fold protein
MTECKHHFVWSGYRKTFKGGKMYKVHQKRCMKCGTYKVPKAL